jgi:hypothetical protein
VERIKERKNTRNNIVMGTFEQDYKAFVKAVVADFRKHYKDWSHVKREDMSICENGDVWVGNTQFKTDVRWE